MLFQLPLQTVSNKYTTKSFPPSFRNLAQGEKNKNQLVEWSHSFGFWLKSEKVLISVLYPRKDLQGLLQHSNAIFKGGCLESHFLSGDVKLEM